MAQRTGVIPGWHGFCYKYKVARMMPEFNPRIRPDLIALWLLGSGIALPVRILRVEHTINPREARSVADVDFFGFRIPGILASQLYLP